MVIIAGALAASAWTPPVFAQNPEATLPSQCYDQAVAPSSVVITCGDAGVIAEMLVWSAWGSAQAQATGVMSVNTCDPDCASGNREEYAVELTADRLRDCEYGEPQYTRVSWSFPAETPFPPGSPGAENPTARFPCPVRPHPDPKIKRMRMWMTGHRAPGERYFVRVHLRLRVCAVRGRAEVVVNETKRVGGETFGEHTRTLKYRQRARCQRRTFRWKLRDEFFGVGTYKVAATIWDKDSQFSKTVSRKSVTLD
jgi:hypothetical protein